MEIHPAPGIIPGIVLFLLIAAAVTVTPVGAVTLKGTISVTSEPEGAAIFLNDEDLGLRTNTVIENVFPGIHYIRLELPGYRTWEKIFEVSEGKVTFIYHEMEPIVGGAFSVSTTPEGAQIYIDGEVSGVSDTVVYDLPVGQHRVLLTHENYADYATVVTITEGMSQSLFHTFEPIPETGRITITSIPPDADVYLNGEFGGTTSLTLNDVTPGTYDIAITKTGYEDWTARVDVAAGKITDVRAELTLAEVQLSVGTVPAGARVYIDDSLAGTSPLETTVFQGLHTIRVEKFGYAVSEQEGDVGSDGVSFSFTLVSMAPQAIEEAERAIFENRVYRTKKAEAALLDAKMFYQTGDSERAIRAAESAVAFARDVDGDGVINSQDISPNLHNVVIYLSPFILLFTGAGVLIKDIVRHRVMPVVKVNLPVTIREEDMLAQATVTADASGGPYRGFVCTVYIDGGLVDHFTSPGTYSVMLGGRSRGVHRLVAHLQVAKERYGTVEREVEETFIIEPAQPVHPVSDENGAGIIDTEEFLSGVEDLYEEGTIDDADTDGDSEE